MNDPVTTYRLQFHKGFTFDHFERIIPYLQQLGISTLYASPIFEAVPGSTHGYDVVNPLQINPEIGTLDQLYTISKKLKKLGIKWLQDIVPNHMAFDQKNEWLMDVLDKGRQSAYADYFDILWDSPVCNGKLMVPFLGSDVDEVLQNKQVQVVYQDGLYLSYGGQNYPLNLQSYATVIGSGKRIPNGVKQLITDIDNVSSVDEYNRIKQTLGQNKSYINTCLKLVNNDVQLLQTIVNDQYYQLCFWQDTNKQINYRRFFTVNGLICLNIQHEKVFSHYHQLIKQLLNDGIFQGLRVDHIDGLYDPETYLKRLRRLAGDDIYIIVEKILEPGESFPPNWPVQGNTGYDFLSTINNLFTNIKSKKPLSKFYQALVHKREGIAKSIHDKKSLILHNYMAGELENLYKLFIDLELAKNKELKKASTEQVKAAIGAVLVYFPVYRFYGNAFPLQGEESDALYQVFKQITKAKPKLALAVDILEHALLKNIVKGSTDNQKALSFYQRLMQFSGPLMAKGVEDTLMYTYNRFIEHNEVGDNPVLFGLTIKKYHQTMANKLKNWPLTMNASSTHDTKRGEDVRARLNVLTDMPKQWMAAVQQWKQINAHLKINNAPDDNDEYFIYQTIAGAYPMPGQDKDDFKNRLQQYLVKALREAKRNSNWAEPDTAYEEATQEFIAEILDIKSGFWKNFLHFHPKLADYGIVNSLGQVLLKYTSPGVADLYQGCELWDLSLVDPDNRRPVNYTHRESLLKELNSSKPGENLWQQLWQNRYNAQIKLALTHILLNQRKLNPEVFSRGDYIPLKVKGKYKANVLAFARTNGKEWYIIALPLQLADIDTEQHLTKFNWDDTKIVLPNDAPAAWQHLLLNTEGHCDEGIKVKDVFSVLPLALLKLKHPDNNRGAGILMHITSLPSAFGIGDMGTEAFAFADFLSNARQKYWQMLPVNPTDSHAGNSPYSSTCSMAGNVLLISPELLVKDGLLQATDVKKHKLSANRPVDYAKALEFKNGLFDTAFQNFIAHGSQSQQQQFELFKASQAYWLDDYALYEVLKSKHDKQPWHQWPTEHKLRNSASINKIEKQNSPALEKIKWLQFVFYSQWQNLKHYCAGKGIKLIGDMPFYVNYDSVDVWANPQLFKLDDEVNMVGIAGVPPDYFSAEGQLWGMPVYRWDELKRSGYQWWISRIKKNLEYFDLIRLDHFRAFAGYWEVPAGEITAVNGVWQQGPGADFFNAVKKVLGSLPFVAEDLGEVDDAIYKLRDDFQLPGMKVLQFAFSDDMPHSTHIPHQYTANSFAYSGTHDNDTAIGWYKQATKAERKRAEKYAGKSLSVKNVHRALSHLCYASIANVAIIPMQDALGLDGQHRMNMPSSADGNWTWRLTPGQLTTALEKWLRKQAVVYGR